jgi:hypothetical protein
MKGAELGLFQNLATNGLAVVQVHVFPLKAGQVTVPTADGASVSVPAGLLEWVESYLVAIKPGTESKVVGAIIATRATVQMAAQKARCLNTVKQICVALVAFADEHQGRLPQSLDQLALGKQLLRCPTAAANAAPSYEFLIPGARLADIKKPSETVMVREINASHDGQRVVGFADAHVEVVKP